MYLRKAARSKRNFVPTVSDDMRRSDRTDMGGPKGSFPATRWSEIGEAYAPDGTHRRAVVDYLVRKYWKPIYCYLRRKGYTNESAKDLTQGFFYELVLGRELIQRANKAKGRFRTFLLTALDHYAINVHRAEVREKRHPKDAVVSLEAFDEPPVSLTSRDMKPDEAFTYAWALELLQEVLDLHARASSLLDFGTPSHYSACHDDVKCLGVIFSAVGPGMACLSR